MDQGFVRPSGEVLGLPRLGTRLAYKMSGKARGEGRPFEPGDPRAGRPKGALNKVTLEVREICGALVEDPEYQAAFRARFISGTLAPPVEQMVWYYKYGKPKETVEVTGANGGPLAFLNMTTAERMDRLRNLLAKESTPEDDWGDEEFKQPILDVVPDASDPDA